MDDFLKFKKMITPVIIQVLFWIGVVGSVLTGLSSVVQGLRMPYGGQGLVFIGMMSILLGPVVARIYCELMIVIFSVNDTLTEIKNLLKNRPSL